MYNITLVFTFHSETGKCNSDEAYKIINLINPEVIFEELPNNLFDKIYNENILGKEEVDFLEIKCIKKYLQNHNVEHIPVDIDIKSDLSSNEINFLFTSFKKFMVYREIETEQRKMITQEGFTYLNSEKCSRLFDEKRITEKKLLSFMDKKLNHIYKTFYEEQDNRENEILRNIYTYSKENHYNQAIFLIGFGHRNSLIQKITEYQTNEKVKLNWTFYNKIQQQKNNH